MYEFMLPLVDDQVTTADALRIVIGTARSGIVIRTPQDARLVHSKELVRALETHKSDLDQIRTFERIVICGPNDWDAAGLRTFPTPTELFAVLEGARRSGLSIATIRSRQESNATPYLPPPNVVKCGNPNEDHFYPPRKRDVLDPYTCFCGYPLP